MRVVGRGRFRGERVGPTLKSCWCGLCSSPIVRARAIRGRVIRCMESRKTLNSVCAEMRNCITLARRRRCTAAAPARTCDNECTNMPAGAGGGRQPAPELTPTCMALIAFERCAHASVPRCSQLCCANRVQRYREKVRTHICSVVSCSVVCLAHRRPNIRTLVCARLSK